MRITLLFLIIASIHGMDWQTIKDGNWVQGLSQLSDDDFRSAFTHPDLPADAFMPAIQLYFTKHRKAGMKSDGFLPSAEAVTRAAPLITGRQAGAVLAILAKGKSEEEVNLGTILISSGTWEITPRMVNQASKILGPIPALQKVYWEAVEKRGTDQAKQALPP